VYATCTISRTEGEEVVEAVVEADPRLEAERLGGTYPGLASTHDERFLQTRPDRDRTSGFFIARLRRRG
jgi:16S rRNA C967 or C1407 C5-methylase (RsmB/RsmF family)